MFRTLPLNRGRHLSAAIARVEFAEAISSVPYFVFAPEPVLESTKYLPFIVLFRHCLGVWLVCWPPDLRVAMRLQQREWCRACG